MPPLCNLHSRTIEKIKLADARTCKIALHFCEMATAVRCILESLRICSYCNAKLFFSEIEGFCCAKEKIKLTSAKAVAPLKNLYTRYDDVGIEFHNNIHAYNSVFAFTSMELNWMKIS
ncbi:1974_t:CDS:2 [Gigaspora margarita]|uniref:1974_t:CDS:1 n=1 Tax=Gigaspora margarita TaxID=4874 RepID=A0ABN7V167_GIGMA|nr:1974_t:CDS:2 [Gigaspora margarita]